MSVSKKIPVCNFTINFFPERSNQKTNESDDIVHACTFENKNEDSVPCSTFRISLNFNAEQSTENNDFGAIDNTRKFTKHKVDRHLGSYDDTADTDDTDDTEKIADDDIQHLVSHWKYDTSENTISGLKTSNQEHTNYSGGPSFGFGTLGCEHNQLYKSIDRKTSVECDSSLASRPLPNILPLLVPTLADALHSGNHTIATSISSYITGKSSKIVERFRCKYQDILKETNV